MVVALIDLFPERNRLLCFFHANPIRSLDLGGAESLALCEGGRIPGVEEETNSLELRRVCDKHTRERGLRYVTRY